MNKGVTMTMPGKTEAGSRGIEPCRGIAWWAHRDDAGRGSLPFALCPKHRIERPPCLENPRPAGAEYSLTENVRSPVHAEPEHLSEPLIARESDRSDRLREHQSCGPDTRRWTIVRSFASRKRGRRIGERAEIPDR